MSTAVPHSIVRRRQELQPIESKGSWLCCRRTKLLGKIDKAVPSTRQRRTTRCKNKCLVLCNVVHAMMPTVASRSNASAMQVKTSQMTSAIYEHFTKTDHAFHLLPGRLSLHLDYLNQKSLRMLSSSSSLRRSRVILQRQLILCCACPSGFRVDVVFVILAG